MRILRVLVAVAILTLVIVGFPHTRSTIAAQTAAPPTISVSGDAEVRVAPDEVVLTLGVETFDPVLKAALTANDAVVRRALDVARRHRVPAEHIQTDYVGIEPRRRASDVSLELLGYAVRKTILIRLRDIAAFEAVLGDALDAGVNYVHGVEFRSTELRRHRDEARTLAVRAAREKAELLAREAGRRLGAVQSVGEASYGYWSSYGSWWGSRYGQGGAQNVAQNLGGLPLESDATLAPGQISIRASVHTVFSMQ